MEVLVAVTAGLGVAFASLILSRNATSFFQQEARISAAQLSVSLGITRLSNDLQHAAFMSTPDIQHDPTVCAGSMAAWPAGLTALAGIQIIQGGSVVGTTLAQSTRNGFSPDAIVIGGAMDSTEQFPVRQIVPAGTGVDVYLQTACGPMVRTTLGSTQGSEGVTDIFTNGRLLRIVDAKGNQEYGVITGFAATGTPPALTATAIVHLNGVVFPQQKAPSNACGYDGFAVGTLANVVSRIRWDIRTLVGNATYNNLVASTAAVNATAQLNSGDNTSSLSGGGRTELVRTELALDNTEVTNELVAEYAVDLEFGVTTATAGNTPTLTRYPITSPPTATIGTMMGAVSAAGAPRPARARALQVRLSTRARVPDRSTDLAVGSDGRRFRLQIDPLLPSPSYARLRTLYADVALPNLTGITW